MKGNASPNRDQARRKRSRKPDSRSDFAPSRFIKYIVISEKAEFFHAPPFLLICPG